MRIVHDPKQAFVLNPNRTTVRFHIPPLPLAGSTEPVIVHLDMDAQTVDQMVARLVELRGQMMPPPKRH